MQQAASPDGLPLDVLALLQDRLPAAEVDVGRREVIEALVDAAVVVVLDKAAMGDALWPQREDSGA